jgi:hypothetical protein
MKLALVLLLVAPTFLALAQAPAPNVNSSPASTRPAPCKDLSRPEYRQFDFWVGEWNVFDRQSGKPVGKSSVQLILNDCVVFENWTGARGGEGKSFNKYNPWLKQWEQYWVDNGPDRLFFTGHLEDAEMRFEADAFTPEGKPDHRKLTFSRQPDGTVRQFSQVSTDGGKAYTVEYDLVYRKREQ